MAKCDYLMEFFYEHIENIKIKYLEILSEILGTEITEGEILEGALGRVETLADLDYENKALVYKSNAAFLDLDYEARVQKYRERKKGISRKDREDFIYIFESELQEVYTDAGRQSDLEGLLREIKCEKV